MGTLQRSSVPHVSHPRPAKMGHPVLLYLSIFLSAVGGFLFGYDTGVIAGAMPLIERDVKFWGEKGSDEATLWLSLITSMTVAFAFIFSFVGGWITERFGRRPAILVASVVLTVGAVVMAVAPTKAVLLVGRIVVGMGIGIASMCIPVYYLFAGMAVLALVWFTLVLPESKGKTLEEMSSLFRHPLWRLGRASQ